MSKFQPFYISSVDRKIIPSFETSEQLTSRIAEFISSLEKSKDNGYIIIISHLSVINEIARQLTKWTKIILTKVFNQDEFFFIKYLLS